MIFLVFRHLRCLISQFISLSLPYGSAFAEKISQRSPKYVRIFAYLSILATLLIVADHIIQIVVHFSFKVCKLNHPCYCYSIHSECYS